MMMYLQATLTSTPKGKIKTKVAPFFLKQYARSHASNARSSLSSLLSSRAPARGEDGTAVPALVRPSEMVDVKAGQIL